MPPKANNPPYHHPPPPPPPSSSPSLSTAADALHSREHFSIASFFDAASARRSGGVGGGGYRLSSSAPPAAASSVPLPSSSRASPAHTAASASSQHWSTTLSLGGANASCSGNAAQLATPPSTAGDVSSTLQEVRRRIIADLAAAQDGSRESASRLHAHRQRALRVAFGEHDSAHKPTSRSGRGGGVADVNGTSPSDARRSKSQHTPDADGGRGDDEDELMVASVEFSLLCPYSRLPMRYPVRSKDCNHLQCCDVDSWVVMLDKCRSMRDPVGPCPVCERRVLSSSLGVDLWMKNVMDQMPPGTHMVVLEPDGTFRNGDTTREKRKEQVMMEVVDATQGDYENYLDDVEDDEDDVVAVTSHCGPSRTHSTAAVAATSLSAAISASSGTRRQRSPSPTEVPRCAGGGATTASGSGARAGPPPLVQVKAEKVAAAEAAAAVTDASTSPAESASQEDGGVVVVHFVEGRHDGRQALPSQIRLWVPHCAQCGAPKVKAEDTAATDGCLQCGHTGKDDWHLVRRFEASSAVLMELTADGTLVLHGVDALAPYLYRAGFHRSLFELLEYASVAERQQRQYRPPAGVWASSFPLSRFEIDFLEACCARVAQGDSLDAIDALIVPSLFRIPRRRRLGNGASTSFTQQPSSSFSHVSGGSGGGARGTLREAWTASPSLACQSPPLA